MISGVNTPPRKDEKKIFQNEEGLEQIIDDKDKSFEDDDLRNHQEQSIIVTPLTNFQEIHKFLDPQKKFLVRNFQNNGNF